MYFSGLWLKSLNRVVWGFTIYACQLFHEYSKLGIHAVTDFAKLQLQVSNFPLCLPSNVAKSFNISFKLFICITLKDDDWERIDFTDAGDEKKVGFSVLHCQPLC